ncbi:signal peptide peptidase SppA [Zymomonas mobilis]|uniref:Signal peptide peptidase SppA, 67K type n=1 Tax=Zymomonas mobilis subsp. mobilis (strain ATCC 10988 / DSM 424 / LMG 404 / NCIMB 8938 / NRRL B-806 / ZM1) TaxID=555217 RepID=A0A0H3G7D9_ZYMMA|nr:signal peptide peptidase SppA [Zymomonas mobilis]AEH63066.1 signal peptide peptidase SppA, 67K type [Zymomonas mobilis subsp. mobilis ATCC 10988]TQL27324.1 signal peptide peptidase A [Zymomonas mobilis]TQL29265.1 signal peptide peptidase A [Zymomonas mobilis]
MKLLRLFWKMLVGIKDVLALILLVLFFGAIFVGLCLTTKNGAISSRNLGAASAADGALLIDFSGNLVEKTEGTSFLDLIQDNNNQNEILLREVVYGLEQAARNPKIKAVVLDLSDFSGGGRAAISAVDNALDKVRAAGKPVLSFAGFYNDARYRIAAHGTEIWLPNLGEVALLGVGGNQLYYKGLLDKLGVETKIYRVGRFKSFVEPFTRTEQSPDAKAANQALANSLWQTTLQDIAHARPKAHVAEWALNPTSFLKSGHSFAELAQSAGMIDHIGNAIDFGNRVASLVGKDKQPGSFKAVSLASFIGSNPPSSAGSAIGVVTVSGEIVDDETRSGQVSGSTISSLILDTLAKGDIKALVVRVDSPGGSVSAAEQMRSAILAAKAKGLPVIVSMGSVAASGGYWISTPADKIFADPSTITGSIGVFSLIPTFQQTLHKIGLSADGVKTTPLSGQPDVFRGTTPEFDQLMQFGVDTIYDRFTSIVASSRHLPLDKVREIAEGRVWSGVDAKKIGLVDQYGSLQDAVTEAAKRAHLDPSHTHMQFIDEEPSFVEMILKNLFQHQASDAKIVARNPNIDAYGSMAGNSQEQLVRIVAAIRGIAQTSTMQARCLECVVEVKPTSQDRYLADRLITQTALRP